MHLPPMKSPKGHLSPDALRSVDWFPKPVRSSESGAIAALAKLLIGVAAGSAMLYVGWTVLGVIVISLATLIGLISMASVRGRGGITRAFTAAGMFLGQAIATIVLVPTYIIGFTAARCLMWLSGNDPLRLRERARPSFWMECDEDGRKVRWIRSMFTTEAPGGRRRVLVPAIAIAAGFAVAAELLLRAMGFGDPIVYRIDAASGYYPAPNQDVGRLGNRIMTNAVGMRSPDITDPKPPGTLRVLLIGDSTLYGGSYIDQSKLYATRLGELLSSPEVGGATDAKDRAVEVLCAGVNGWGPFHKLGYIERFGAFDADIAVICLPYGDVYRPFSGIEGKPHLPEHARPTLALEQVAYHLLWRIQASVIGAQSAQDQQYNAVRGIEAYGRLASTLRAAGCDVLVEVLPSRSAGTAGSVPDDEARRVSELRVALGAQGVDAGFPAGLFSATDVKGRIYHDEVHLHEDGHRLYAEYLNSRIRGTSARFGTWSGPQPATASPEGAR
jgi:hypothetical protein